MNIQDLRRLKFELEEQLDFRPPGESNDRAWERAEAAAIEAQSHLDRIAPVLTLLDAVDAMAARIDGLAERVAELETTPEPSEESACTCFVGDFGIDPHEHDAHCPAYGPF